MAPDEYSSTGGGGKLKLKGGKVSDGRVEKRKKKKGLKKEKEDSSNQTRSQDQEVAERGPEGTDQEKTPAVEDERDEMPEGSAAKTEAERKYEEVRRKRLHERLQKEGIKTHKERVEELNKYLSRLSEHHDMPKIGPG